MSFGLGEGFDVLVFAFSCVRIGVQSGTGAGDCVCV